MPSASSTSAHFWQVTGERVALTGCVAARADLSGADLTGWRVVDCDLAGADVSGVTATDLRLHGSALDGLRGATSLRGAVVDTAQVAPLALRLFDALGIVVDDERERAVDRGT